MEAHEEKRHFFTAVRDPMAEHIVTEALMKFSAEISSTEGLSECSVLLGGGYGRGEGGVCHEADGSVHLYNDLDVFVFLPNGSAKEIAAMDRRLKSIGAAMGEKLGIDVDVAMPRLYRDIPKVSQTLMYQELLRGHVIIFGKDILSRFVPALNADQLPWLEAVRLLLNRGMGLLFAGEHLHANSSDHDFIIRNLHKAALGSGDAILLASRLYQWTAMERQSAFQKLCDQRQWPTDYKRAYEEGIRFKFRPHRQLPSQPWKSWLSVCRFWLDAVCIILGLPFRSEAPVVSEALHRQCHAHGNRTFREAVRWLLRMRSLGPGGLSRLADAPVCRLLDTLYRQFLSAVFTQSYPVRNSTLYSGWLVFN